MLIDTHCHLDFPDYNQDRDAVLKRAKSEGIEAVINIGSSLKGSRDSVELSEKYDFVYASVGLHPHEADEFTEQSLETIESLARNKKVVAVGEIGLDYFKNFSKHEKQRTQFIRLLDLAKKLNLPAILHCRDAQEDLLGICKEKMPFKAVVHCFSGDEAFLKSCLDLGFFVSFTCNITYKKAENLRQIVKAAPLDRVLLETDAPFLSPESLRGKRNEPQNVKVLADKIARIKGIEFNAVADITTKNSKSFFNLA
jgi:TatD DNase family protein